jgi:hypothetical protein
MYMHINIYMHTYTYIYIHTYTTPKLFTLHELTFHQEVERRRTTFMGEGLGFLYIFMYGGGFRAFIHFNKRSSAAVLEATSSFSPPPSPQSVTPLLPSLSVRRSLSLSAFPAPCCS